MADGGSNDNGGSAKGKNKARGAKVLAKLKRSQAALLKASRQRIVKRLDRILKMQKRDQRLAARHAKIQQSLKGTSGIF